MLGYCTNKIIVIGNIAISHPRIEFKQSQVLYALFS